MLFLAFSICLCGREQFHLGQFQKLFSVKLTKKQIKIGQISIYVISAFHKKEKKRNKRTACSIISKLWCVTRGEFIQTGL